MSMLYMNYNRFIEMEKYPNPSVQSFLIAIVNVVFTSSLSETIFAVITCLKHE